MGQEQLFDMSVDTIMRRWPATIPIFLKHKMHCIGCPVGELHTLDDASRAHRLERTVLAASLLDRIAQH